MRYRSIVPTIARQMSVDVLEFRDSSIRRIRQQREASGFQVEVILPIDHRSCHHAIHCQQVTRWLHVPPNADEVGISHAVNALFASALVWGRFGVVAHARLM